MTTSKIQSPLSLPVIDFCSQNLKPETPEWDSVRAQVRKSQEEYGCFEATFDGASMELRKAIFKATEEVFDLPLETKLSTKSGKIIYQGYLTIPTMPLYEGMGFYGVDRPEVVDDLTHKLWPHGNITFSKNVQSFAEKLIELNVKVRTMILESFGLDKYIEEHLNSATNHLQIFKYKGLGDTTEENIDCLDIKTKDDEEWIKARPSQDTSYLVIAGASFHLPLNDGVFPPLHRVVMTGKKDRYVAGLFSPPKEGLIINAPEEIVDDEHPRLYKPFDFEAYLKFSNRSFTVTKGRDLSSLKSYCSL